jgi:hypothetical protein
MRRASCVDVVFLVLLFLYVWIAQKNSDSGFLVYRRYVSVWFAVQIGILLAGEVVKSWKK